MIETKDLRKTFRNRRSEVHAVAGVDLLVKQGEIFGLLGPNGAGKTTTLRMLATLLGPTSGTASVAGADLLGDAAEVRRRIGNVSQAGGTDGQLSARQELVLQARLYGVGKVEAVARADESIEAFELTECARRPARSYSGGQRRRLDLAIGLVHRPRLVFLDEPTSGLDPQSRANLWDRVRRLRDEGLTILLTTHYLDDADELCDRLAIIDHGVVVAEGSPDELKRQVAGDVVRLRADDPDRAAAVLSSQPFVREVEATDRGLSLYVDRGESALPDVLRLLEGAGLRLLEVSLHRPSLDDVFLRQTGRSLRDPGSDTATAPDPRS
jgi:ABC-2 type transport system ATP-binding protein